MIREKVTYCSDIGHYDESDVEYTRDCDENASSLHGSVFVNKGTSVINDTKGENPDDENM